MEPIEQIERARARRLWHTLMAGGVVSWFLVILLGYILFPDDPAKASIPLAIEFLIHVAEIPHGIRLGRARGLSAARSGLKTFVFGFTWWLPMKRRIIEK